MLIIYLFSIMHIKHLKYIIRRWLHTVHNWREHKGWIKKQLTGTPKENKVCYFINKKLKYEYTDLTIFVPG